MIAMPAWLSFIFDVLGFAAIGVQGLPESTWSNGHMPGWLGLLTAIVAYAAGKAAKQGVPLLPGKPAVPPPVTILALLFGMLLIVSGAQGCGDDGKPFYRVATCDSGRQAWRAGSELICYEVDSTPYGPRPWMDDTPEAACAYCEGFLSLGGAP